MSLSSMLQIELPHVNIFSKMDLIKQYGPLKFNLDYYTDVLDLNYLLDTLDSDRILSKFKNLNKKICDIVQDYSLVSFIPLNIQKKKSIIRCIQTVDKANGNFNYYRIFKNFQYFLIPNIFHFKYYYEVILMKKFMKR